MKYTFNKRDYDSNDGMMTSVWGPPLWHVLHTISFNYPVKPTKEIKEYYYNYFTSLQHVLPCIYCRNNFKNNLKESKFNRKVLKNRDVLSRWVFKLHETVNKNLGKKSGLKFEHIRERYEHFRSRCVLKSKKVTKVEKGCTEPLYGVKSKCVLNIVPKTSKKKSLTIDPKCQMKKSKKKK